MPQAHITIFRTLNKRFALSDFPLPVYGEGERGGESLFADIKLYGYRQNLYAGAKLPVCTRRKHKISIAIPRRRRGGGKERKPPVRGGFTPSKQPAGRSLFEAQKRIPHSAECGSRLCLENPQTLKSLIKLSSCFTFNKNRKFPSRRRGNSPSFCRRQITIRRRR